MIRIDISIKADRVLSLYKQLSDGQYFGESRSQLQHALQTAKLALDTGADLRSFWRHFFMISAIC